MKERVQKHSTMTTAPESKSTRHARRTAHTPRPLPAWLQVGVVVLLLVNGVQTALHIYSGQGSRVAQTPPPSSREQLSGFEYSYQPDRLVSTAQTTPSNAPQARYDYGYPETPLVKAVELASMITWIMIPPILLIHWAFIRVLRFAA
jgi:hypothetical protein